MSPRRPPHSCAQPGCPELVDGPGPRCRKHEADFACSLSTAQAAQRLRELEDARHLAVEVALAERLETSRRRVESFAIGREGTSSLSKTLHAEPDPPIWGVSRILRRDGVVMAVRLTCKAKRCGRCGPLLRRQKAAHYPARLAEADAAYSAEVVGSFDARKITRAGGRYVTVPGEGGARRVFATVPFRVHGDDELVEAAPVADVGEALTCAFAAVPADERNVGGSRDWAFSHAKEPSGWELLGVASVPMAELVDIARHTGVLRGRVSEDYLAPARGEAWLLDDSDPDAWTWFARRIRLHDPLPRQRRYRVVHLERKAG